MYICIYVCVYVCICRYVYFCMLNIMFTFIFYAQRVCFINTYISLHVFYVYGLLSELKHYYYIYICMYIYIYKSDIQYIYTLYIYMIVNIWASSDVVNCLAILAKAPVFLTNTNCFSQIFLHPSRQQQTLTYSACFSTKNLVPKLAQMCNFCLAKSDVQMATGSASLPHIYTYIYIYMYVYVHICRSCICIYSLYVYIYIYSDI